MTIQAGSSAIVASSFDTNLEVVNLMLYWQAIGTAEWHAETVARSNTVPAGRPSVAQVGNSAVIAALFSDVGLMFYWQTIGTAEWHPEMVAGRSAIMGAPSVSQVGNSSVIAARSTDGSLMFYWQTIGTAEWHPEMVAGPRTTVGGPSVSQVGNSSVIAARSTDGSLMFYWQTIGTAEWHAETVAGPGTTDVVDDSAGTPSVAWVGNSAVIAAQLGDNNLGFFWQTIGTAEWHPETVTGPLTTYFGASVAPIGIADVILDT